MSAPSGREPPQSISFWQRAFSIDRRTLGLTRILIGSLLLLDLVHRAPAWFTFYGDDGVFPRAFARTRGAERSLFLLAGTHAELTVLFVVLALVYTCVLLGLFSRVAHVLAFLGWTSMTLRMPLSANSGYTLVTQLLAWTCLLPMGARFSVDALRASLAHRVEERPEQLDDRDGLDPPEQREPFVALVVGGIILQICAIYLIGAAGKSGHTWRDGTAVHYAVYCEEFTTPFAAAVRAHVPRALMKAASTGTLIVEFAVPLVVLPPFPWTRRFALAALVFLHLGFGVFLALGPFAWGCCCFASLLVSSDDWELALQTMRREHRARVVVVPEGDPSSLLLARILARLDAFRLLRFESGEAKGRIAVRDPGGRVSSGRHALAGAVAALPLGPVFAWALALPPGELVRALLRPASRALLALPALRFAPLPLVRDAVTAFVMLTAVSEIAKQNQDLWKDRVGGYRYRRPEILGIVPDTFRLYQGWQLFSPDPFKRTKFTVVDAVTIDGRHLDPFTGKPPRTEFTGPLSAEGYPQHWLDFFRRQLRAPRNCPALLDWVKAYPVRTGRDEDAIVSARIYTFYQDSPPFGRVKKGRTYSEPLCSFRGDEDAPRASDPSRSGDSDE